METENDESVRSASEMLSPDPVLPESDTDELA